MGNNASTTAGAAPACASCGAQHSPALSCAATGTCPVPPRYPATMTPTTYPLHGSQPHYYPYSLGRDPPSTQR